MTSIADLEIFAKVVTAGSMSAAGRELDLSPAVVSKRISHLETRLGTRLFHRTTRQLQLTETGRGFYERVVQILATVQEAEAFVSSGHERAGRLAQDHGADRVQPDAHRASSWQVPQAISRPQPRNHRHRRYCGYRTREYQRRDQDFGVGRLEHGREKACAMPADFRVQAPII